MDQNTVGIQVLHCHPAQFFVGSVHGVTRLKGNHALPTPLRNLISNFHGRSKRLGKIGLKIRVIQHVDRSRQEHSPLTVKRYHTWMRGILSAKNFARHKRHIIVR